MSATQGSRHSASRMSHIRITLKLHRRTTHGIETVVTPIAILCMLHRILGVLPHAVLERRALLRHSSKGHWPLPTVQYSSIDRMSDTQVYSVKNLFWLGPNFYEKPSNGSNAPCISCTVGQSKSDSRHHESNCRPHLECIKELSVHFPHLQKCLIPSCFGY